MKVFDRSTRRRGWWLAFEFLEKVWLRNEEGPDGGALLLLAGRAAGLLHRHLPGSEITCAARSMWQSIASLRC
jgi:hypothetical protein